MGMILQLMRVTEGDVKTLRANPAAIEAFLETGMPAVDYDPEYAKALEDLKRQMGGSSAPSLHVSFDHYAFDDVFDCDKMWSGLYYLLTGSAYEGEPPANWLLNSPPVGEDLGYGPAMVISAANTKILSDYLNGLDRKAVLNRFDGAEMLGLNLYPNIWDEDEDELKKELGHAFDKLRAYCGKCAAHELGMLSYIN